MKPAGGTITLRDVAERAGVSITTVSRILNGRETGVPVREAPPDERALLRPDHDRPRDAERAELFDIVQQDPHMSRGDFHVERLANAGVVDRLAT